MIKYFSVNGEILPTGTAAIGITDLGLLRGLSLFDFFLVKNRQSVFIEDYLDRFWRSAWQLKLSVPADRETLLHQINALLDANGQPDTSIRLVLTGGYSDDGYTLVDGRANLLILQHGFPVYPSEKYTLGIKLLLHEYTRQFPTIKTTNYVVGILLREELSAAGADDLLFHRNGAITETTRANFFLVMPDDTVVTAGEGILEGVTRKYTLRLAHKHYPVEERYPTLDDLRRAKGAFITSSTKRIMPVVQVSDVIIGDGRPEAVTQHLMELLREAEKAYNSQMV